jgi:nitroreductase
MNLQPWSFAVVRGTERLHDMSQRCKKYALEHIPSTSELYSHLTNPNFEIFHNAPTLIIVCAQDAQAQSAEDCCLAAHNIMLAACAQSLGTCWIGLARQWLNQAEIKAELGIPASMVPVAPIIVGHPGGKMPPTPREPARIIWCLEDHMPVMVST